MTNNFKYTFQFIFVIKEAVFFQSILNVYHYYEKIDCFCLSWDH
jgi:hypothetical protein